MKLLDEFVDTKYKNDEDIGHCRIKVAASRLWNAVYQLDNLNLGFYMICYLPMISRVQIKRLADGRDTEFIPHKIKLELILEANRLQLNKQDLNKKQTAFLNDKFNNDGARSSRFRKENAPGIFCKINEILINWHEWNNLKRNLLSFASRYKSNTSSFFTYTSIYSALDLATIQI